ncbi:MAG: hypothetical protein M3238_01785 [Actinomycetota bacterium]|nr:hypothetical protein [Actinomycetota bacterium]
MTPVGTIELPLLLMQATASTLAAWAGMRVVDDVRMWKARRARAQQRP